MRRRSKPRVVWLPPSNTNTVDPANRSAWGIFSVPGIAAAVGSKAGAEIPIVMDGIQSDPLNDTSSLADVQNSGYRLRRIVGKLFIFLEQNEETVPSLIGVTAGFIIRRVRGETGASLAGLSGVADQIDPADIDNSMDPWIWRRSWILQNGQTHFGEATGLSNEVYGEQKHRGPSQNFGIYSGGNVEGPTVDQKTARIVGPEERLFLDVSAVNLVGGTVVTSLTCIYEFRVLASMRSSVGNRRNASR